MAAELQHPQFPEYRGGENLVFPRQVCVDPGGEQRWEPTNADLLLGSAQNTRQIVWGNQCKRTCNVLAYIEDSACEDQRDRDTVCAHLKQDLIMRS